MPLVSIVERQRLAIRLAFAESTILSHRHFSIADRQLNWFPRKNTQATRNKCVKKQGYVPPRKFSVEEAATIRTCYEAGGISYRELAIAHHTCKRCINHVVRRWGAYRADP